LFLKSIGRPILVLKVRKHNPALTTEIITEKDIVTLIDKTLQVLSADRLNIVDALMLIRWELIHAVSQPYKGLGGAIGYQLKPVRSRRVALAASAFDKLMAFFWQVIVVANKPADREQCITSRLILPQSISWRFGWPLSFFASSRTQAPAPPCYNGVRN
jgi:hypothetical protein